MKNTRLISQLAIASGVLSLISLLPLHFLSYEIDPTWHMVSEYAFGQYGWVLSIFFFSWALSYWLTAFTLFPLSKSWIYKLGVILIFISGVGALMGGLFDVQHSLHGLAFAIGVPFVPIVAPLVTRYLQRKFKTKDKFAFYLSHLTWISFILMAIAMISFISQMQAVGALNTGTPELMTSLPEGVNSIIGIPNRLLVVSYIGWLIAINLLSLKFLKAIKK